MRVVYEDNRLNIRVTKVGNVYYGYVNGKYKCRDKNSNNCVSIVSKLEDIVYSRKGEE